MPSPSFNASGRSRIASPSFTVATTSVFQAPEMKRACTARSVRIFLRIEACLNHWLSQNPSIFLSMKMNWPGSLIDGASVASLP